jgi:hypothetical protein
MKPAPCAEETEIASHAAAMVIGTVMKSVSNAMAPANVFYAAVTVSSNPIRILSPNHRGHALSAEEPGYARYVAARERSIIPRLTA